MPETDLSHSPPAGAIAGEQAAAALRAATEALRAVAGNRELLRTLSVEERTALLTAAGEVYNPDAVTRRQSAKELRRREKAAKRQRDERLLAASGIRVLREKPVFTTPNLPAPERHQRELAGGDPRPGLIEPQHCYVCKCDYSSVHPFYDQLCDACGTFNFAKRGELADLSGRVALVTGGRVKIGYQAVLKLLRCGAAVIVTTRFPRNAATRFGSEHDFEAWGERLEIFGLDLRHSPSVEAFCRHLTQTRDRLDFLINNACQTVRRPPAFYRHMLDAETDSERALNARLRGLLGGYEGVSRYDMLSVSDRSARPLRSGTLPNPAALSQLALVPEDVEAAEGLFPDGELDADLQQVDRRGRNSWRLLLDEVSAVELLETQLVNAVAPYLLNARLKPLMVRTATRDKHIVNVSAVEGQFYRRFKTTRHPHTNMAKAALNMMTRTAAADYVASGIHMNSVDTGWVTDEDPLELARQKTAEHGFRPPLDIVDGAARILDPIIDGVNSGHHVWGQFLKDYRSTDW